MKAQKRAVPKINYKKKGIRYCLWQATKDAAHLEAAYDLLRELRVPAERIVQVSRDPL